MLGLFGFDPETLDSDEADRVVARVAADRQVSLLGVHKIAFDPETDIIFAYDVIPELHPNGMKLTAYDQSGVRVFEETYYSTGGGFIATAKQLRTPAPKDQIATGRAVPFPFGYAAELLAHCARENKSIEEIVYANEDAMRPRAETDARLDRVVTVMTACIERGLAREGTLPGSLQVKRRAPAIWKGLQAQPQANEPERLFDWLNVYAMAVNEENAAGGQVVTAPTNGAAGILPAILKHYCLSSEDPARDARRFLLTAAGIGLLLQAARFDLRRRDGLPRRGRGGVFDGGRWIGRGLGRKPPADRQRRRDRHGAQSRPHLRSGGRPRANPLHRAQRRRRRQSGQRRAPGAALNRAQQSFTRSSDRDHASDRLGYVVQIQGDEPGRTGRERGRVLRPKKPI